MSLRYGKIWQNIISDFPDRIIEEPIHTENFASTCKSAAAQKIVREVLRLRGYLSPVCLIGERGAGKSYWARIIHQNSHHARGPFVAVDLEDIPSRLVEAYLFGEEEPLSLLPSPEHTGKIWEAYHGTVYIHQIHLLTRSAQQKLIHLIKNRFVETAGGKGAGEQGKGNGNGNNGNGQLTATPIRVIVGSTENLKGFVDRGLFRKDLYYRLTVFPIRVPPLRERKEDIGALAMEFLRFFASMFGKKVTGIAAGSMNWMLQYYWPGNLDELREFILLNVYYAPDELSGELHLRLMPELLAKANKRSSPSLLEREFKLNGLIEGE